MVNDKNPPITQTATRAGRPLTDAKRRAILAGATSVFLEYGFGGSTMEEVARMAGVSKATLYRYFRDKEALFSGVIADVCDRIIDDKLATSMADMPPDEALSAFGYRVLKTLFAPESIELQRIVVAETKRFPMLGSLFYDSGPRGSISILANYLRRHVDDPRLEFDDPWRAAEEYLEVLRGYTHLRLLYGVDSACSEEEMTERVERAVLQLLAKQPTDSRRAARPVGPTGDRQDR